MRLNKRGENLIKEGNKKLMKELKAGKIKISKKERENFELVNNILKSLIVEH